MSAAVQEDSKNNRNAQMFDYRDDVEISIDEIEKGLFLGKIHCGLY